MSQKMVQSKKEKVMELFFEYPEKEFTVREIANYAKISKSTAQRYLKELEQAKLVNGSADMNLHYRLKKMCFFIEKIADSGLLEYLAEHLNPSCIILFGSVQKGDSVKKSDIDLFIETPVSKQLDLTRFERKLKHPIQLFIESDIKNIQPRLRNNIINGIKLYGSLNLK